MARPLGIILAGGKGSRLMPLTSGRAKPAVAFAGGYRLIDFALSNLVNSGIEDVWIIEQYAPHSLNDHLAAGRPWDLDRMRGGLRVLPPFEPARDANDEDGGFAGGNAEALAKHADAIAAFGPSEVIVLSADHVTRLDLRPMLADHRERGAAVTMAVRTMAEGDDVSRYSVVGVRSGRVTRFDYKPKKPRGRTIATEAFVYDASRLLAALRTEGSGEGDYGESLVPGFVEADAARAWPHKGYWRDVGTLESYWLAHMELLDSPDDLGLADPAWPILTHPGDSTIAELIGAGEARGSILAAGSRVAGSVRRSVIGRGATVMAGARVENSVVLPGATVRAGVTVRRGIVDEGFSLGKDLVARRGVAVASSSA